MRQRRVEIAAAHRMPVGAWVHVGGEGPLEVIGCTGRGPYVIALAPVGRWRRARARVAYWARRARRWWLSTRYLRTRCEDGWCWRRATADELCDRHWLRAVEDGEVL